MGDVYQEILSLVAALVELPNLIIQAGAELFALPDDGCNQCGGKIDDQHVQEQPGDIQARQLEGIVQHKEQVVDDGEIID